MKKVFILFTLFFIAQLSMAQEAPYKGNYELASRFSPEKLKKMIFSTSVNPHWLKNSDRFWYEYETSDGKNWYLVNPATRTKTALFDKDALAAQLTLAVKDPFDGQHLDLKDLKFLENENAGSI